MTAEIRRSGKDKGGLHPRSRHRARYDFASLIQVSPELASFVQPNPAGDDTINFANPAAVLALNRALLRKHYTIAVWDLPPGYLCPPVPGRADYLHHLADLLAGGATEPPPRGPQVRILDIGVGANSIFPIIGVAEYGWSFVGTDIDATAIAHAKKIAQANPTLGAQVEFRVQTTPRNIFRGVVKPNEQFAASICNPPFHASSQDAAAGTARKLRNLHGMRPLRHSLNFGGRHHELWCAGGEAAFVQRMITQSAERPEMCGWFTTLVSKGDNLPIIHRSLKAVNVSEVRTIPLAHGQKQSRIVAWRFSTEKVGGGFRHAT